MQRSWDTLDTGFSSTIEEVQIPLRSHRPETSEDISPYIYPELGYLPFRSFPVVFVATSATSTSLSGLISSLHALANTFIRLPLVPLWV